MKAERHGKKLAVAEHLTTGNPITRLEALVLFGVQNLTDIVSELRKQGWVIKSHQVCYAKAIKRVNEYAVFHPPKDLPVREIQLTEYWVSE